MKIHCALFVILTYASLFVPDVLGKDAPEQLVERANQISNIRAAGSPSYRLVASFTIYSQGKRFDGTYTEIAVPGESWRREIQFENFHRLEVGQGNRRWTVDNRAEAPKDAFSPEGTLQIWRSDPELWSHAKVSQRDVAGVKSRCVLGKSIYMEKRTALCFDDDGKLTENTTPLETSKGLKEEVCHYKDYVHFGAHQFPKVIQCTENGTPSLQLNVTELTVLENPDGALFGPFRDGNESTDCQGSAKAPKRISGSEPEKPRRDAPRDPVVVGLKIGTDGRPHDLSVLKSAQPDFDRAAVESVRGWKFDPARCDGVPMEVTVSVEVVFH